MDMFKFNIFLLNIDDLVTIKYFKGKHLYVITQIRI